jgi:hypothetical protein
MSSMSFSLYSFPARIARRFVPVAVLALSCVCASASVVTFTGQDPNAGPGNPRPNSDAAAASFDAAAALLGTVSTITFESAPLGAFSSLTIAPGVTLTGADYLGNQQNILGATAFPTNPPLGGSNTTAGGSRYADELGGTLTFTFATPTQFFGAYLTGIQTAFFLDTFTFSDGTSETVSIPGDNTNANVGSLDFVGFTDAGKSITSVTINGSNANGADEFGVDDVRFQGPDVSPVPEPGSLTLVFSGLASLGMGYRKFRT